MTREDALRWSDLGSRLLPWAATALLGYGATLMTEVRRDISELRSEIHEIKVKMAEDRGTFGRLEQRLNDHERNDERRMGVR